MFAYKLYCKNCGLIYELAATTVKNYMMNYPRCNEKDYEKDYEEIYENNISNDEE